MKAAFEPPLVLRPKDQTIVLVQAGPERLPVKLTLWYKPSAPTSSAEAHINDAFAFRVNKRMPWNC